ncbi:MAG TPA: HD domain-containing protein [Euryarchaeota archaeon]|nr:HD domain-containing protein [Euryarchaeota archaeon]
MRFHLEKEEIGGVMKLKGENNIATHPNSRLHMGDVGSCEILSYYYRSRGKEVKESLKKHIESGLELIGNISGSRLMRAGTRICEDFQNLLKISFVFHDIGKVFYQRNLRERNGTEYLSFRGHEYFSAYILDSCLIELIKEGVKENIWNSTTFSVLYHHHAMNLSLRWPRVSEHSIRLGFEKLESLRNVLNEIWDKFNLESVIKFKIVGGTLDNLSKLVDGIGNDGYKLFQAEVRRVVDDEVDSKLWLEFATTPKLRKLYLLSLQSLVAVDYIASLWRGGGRGVFQGVIDEFWKLYAT